MVVVVAGVGRGGGDEGEVRYLFVCHCLPEKGRCSAIVRISFYQKGTVPKLIGIVLLK